MSVQPSEILKERKSHIWARQAADWYQEPPWVSERLFDVEPFCGTIFDPCTGGGNVIRSAWRKGYEAFGADVVDRGFQLVRRGNFFDCSAPHANIVSNPPFNVARQFAEHAVKIAESKVALIFPTARLNAAAWLRGLPLARVWLLTPRPSMPPGEAILRGEKPGGGKVDFAWLVFSHGHTGAPAIAWLHRDGA